jgi:hypothetical protein
MDRSDPQAPLALADEPIRQAARGAAWLGSRPGNGHSHYRNATSERAGRGGCSLRRSPRPWLGRDQGLRLNPGHLRMLVYSPLVWGRVIAVILHGCAQAGRSRGRSSQRAASSDAMEVCARVQRGGGYREQSACRSRSSLVGSAGASCRRALEARSCRPRLPTPGDRSRVGVGCRGRDLRHRTHGSRMAPLLIDGR